MPPNLTRRQQAAELLRTFFDQGLENLSQYAVCAADCFDTILGYDSASEAGNAWTDGFVGFSWTQDGRSRSLEVRLGSSVRPTSGFTVNYSGPAQG